jgi:glutathione peroxidase
MSTPIQNIPVRRITGEDTNLGEYSGKVLLVVNVASKCGLTKQYEGLEKLYRDYRELGLVVAGFPANDFRAQEPGTNAEIESFCTSNFGVDFPLFEKITVVGEGKHPLYKELIAAQPKAISTSDVPFSRMMSRKFCGISRSSWLTGAAR